MGDVIKFERRPVRIGGFEIVPEYSAGDEGPGYKFVENPVAKSTTSVLKATVCQICGHPFDGKKNASFAPDGGPCQCFCHKN